jgi:8-oxo-dGTP pyrophosphatase MutT (NUDIX family)
MEDKADFIQHVIDSLSPLNNLKILQQDGLRPAAVLVPLIWEEEEWKLLFIHRAEIGEFHRGEVAFPGGGEEKIDTDLISTALRETKEELGIISENIKVLGFLNSISSVSNYLVTPIVGEVTWPTNVEINPEEVTRIFTIPVNWLKDTANWAEKEIYLPIKGNIKTIKFKEFDGEDLWGLTARITVDFILRIK